MTKDNNTTIMLLLLIGFVAGALFMHVVRPLTPKPSTPEPFAVPTTPEPFAVPIPPGGSVAVRRGTGKVFIISGEVKEGRQYGLYELVNTGN